MSPSLRSHALRHPEQIHAALWRASQLARPCHNAIPTGHALLDQHLPGGGWPLSALIEIMAAQAGVGEIQLLRPALSRIEPGRSIALVNPPYTPSSLCLKQWFGSRSRILLVRPQTTADTLWAIEKILHFNACGALLCWITKAHPASLRRLHLSARQSSTLFFSLRPPAAAAQISLSPLRLHLQAAASGLNITILKRRGPVLPSCITVPLHPPLKHVSLISPHHVALDQHLSPASLPEQQYASMAH